MQILRIDLSFECIFPDTLTDRNQQCFIDLPKCLDQGVLEQLICDQFNGFILIVTASGRIVFASPTVEHLLGHLQVIDF